MSFLRTLSLRTLFLRTLSLRALSLWTLAGVAVTAGAGCTEPNLNEYVPRTGIITGEIIYRGEPPAFDPADRCPDRGPDRGNVVITLFAEDELPPPDGDASPVNVVVVPAVQMFGGGTADGFFSAPYTIPTVAPGTYQVRAFLDIDGDFSPSLSFLSQASAEDIGGGHLDPATGRFLPVTVAADQNVGQVTIQLVAPFLVERPVFSVTSSLAVEVGGPVRSALRLTATAVARPELCLEPDRSAFIVQYVDADGDGQPEDLDEDGWVDVYPQVELLRIDEVTPGVSVVVGAVVDPTPFLDRLRAGERVTVESVDVYLRPGGVAVGADGARQALPEVPLGRYQVRLQLGTGQTWEVPNALDSVQPTAEPSTCPQGSTLCGQAPEGCPCRCPDPAGPAPSCADPAIPAQCQCVELGRGAPTGGLTGTLRVPTTTAATAFVFAYAADDPPPPAGRGAPVGYAHVSSTEFTAETGRRTAAFRVAGLPGGRYSVHAVYDVDGGLSPLSPLFAQPSAADYTGGTEALSEVRAGGDTDVGTIELAGPVGTDRPVFTIDAPTLSPLALPTSIALTAKRLEVLNGPPTAVLPVTLEGGDANGDNLVDLGPRAWLTKLADTGDPRSAPPDSAGVRIFALVDPLPFISALASGMPRLDVSRFDLIVADHFVDAAGREGRPPPPGRYRVDLVLSTGQTWSVPSDVDLVLDRVGGPREDPGQAAVVQVAPAAVPAGRIAGLVLLASPASEDYSVIVQAFRVDAPPPPRGDGVPVATTVVAADRFTDGQAPYVLTGLATGRYTVRAFVDLDGDFVPWFAPTRQPTAGDLAGGALVVGQDRLRVVEVVATGPLVDDVDVGFLEAAVLATDAPSFFLPPGLQLDRSVGSVDVVLSAFSATSDVLSIDGVFVVNWVDLDEDGQADDLDGDGAPDVYPVVEAHELDDSLLRRRPNGVRLRGMVDPGQFAGLGFPAADGTDFGSPVSTDRVTVTFSAMGEDGDGQPVAAPAGRYAVTVVGVDGQTWTSPNVLYRAAGTLYAEHQDRFLRIERD